jgi:hypothetical protein
VLLLSAAVPETRLAGSLLLYRLFQDYPADRLLAVGPATRAGSDLLACEYRYLRPAPSARFDLTRFAAAKRSLEALGLVGRIPLGRAEAAVGKFTPDVVVSVMERRDYVDVAHRYCAAHAVPLVLIVHDRVESFDLVYPGFKRAQIAGNARTYRFASARLCISPQMAESLQEIYGAPGTVLYPNRAEAMVARAVEESRTLKSPGVLTLGYAGSLAYGYGDRIREVMPRLADAGVRLRVYSRDQLPAGIPGTVHAGTFVTTEELWARVRAESDAVWLPYSTDGHHRRLYQTHFPSKLTEYMALGMPVLITGPPSATGVQWGLGHPAAALTVAGSSIDDIRDAALRLRDEPTLRVALAQGSNGGDREFDPALIREQFIDVLRTVAAARPS